MVTIPTTLTNEQASQLTYFINLVDNIMKETAAELGIELEQIKAKHKQDQQN